MQTIETNKVWGYKSNIKKSTVQQLELTVATKTKRHPGINLIKVLRPLCRKVEIFIEWH